MKTCNCFTTTHAVYGCCFQVRPLPEVTAGMERACGQIQQHGRAPGVRRQGGLRPGHQVLLQRPRRSRLPHVSAGDTLIL